MDKTEKKLLDQWDGLLSEAEKTTEYDRSLTYGVYQIFAEIDKSYKDENGEIQVGRMYAWDIATLYKANILTSVCKIAGYPELMLLWKVFKIRYIYISVFDITFLFAHFPIVL